jgi:hypothetical protein
MPKFLTNTKALIGLGVIGALLISVLSLFVMFNNAQKDMVKREAALSAQYLDNQNELSTYVSTIKESLGIADRNTQALDQVLADAVKGRYDGDTSAKPGGGALFSAITEAYPDLSSVSVPYQKVQDAVFSGREAYKNQQTRLLDMLREYDTWRNSGLIHKHVVSMVGAPSQNLKAQIGTQINRGQDAEDQMYLIVTAGDAQKAYQTGTMDPLDLGPTGAPSPK